MVTFPNCKINIGLNILGKREDGYHNIQTVFYPIPITDALEVIECPNSGEAIKFTASGIHVPGKAGSNLCTRAYEILKQDFPGLPSIKMHLHKVIPMGAGLGGGSADAAFTLELLNSKFSLQLSSEQLMEYALQLGRDCPFFIFNKPCVGTGRGEVLTPIELDVSAYKIFLINPGIDISTHLAFSQITIAEQSENLAELILKPIKEWKQFIFNDFEIPVFNTYSEIADIKTALYGNGALYAGMSGSGSTVYGIFQKAGLSKMNFPTHYFQRWI